jgi:hypothetical protein
MTNALNIPPETGHTCSGNASTPLAPVVVTKIVSSLFSKTVHAPVTRRQRYALLTKNASLKMEATNLVNGFAIRKVGGVELGSCHVLVVES